MPRRRQPMDIWRETRRAVWERDGGICQSPDGPHKQFCTGKAPLPLRAVHIDHIRSGKLGSNHIDNLRTLCPICHALRADPRHRALTGKYLRRGLLPVNWREYVWE